MRFATEDEQRKAALAMRTLAIRAGRRTLAYFRSDTLRSRSKSDGTPVSEADLAANDVILEGLRAAFPGVVIVTEETGGDRLTDPAQPFFLIDPLDGTKEFINGSGEYTVNIALIVDRKPLLGVVYAPAVDRLFWVRRAGEAVEETAPHAPDRVGATAPLRCRTADNAALTAILSKSHFTGETASYVDHYRIAASSHAGSSLKFCLLAAAEADFYPRLGRTMEWDTAAADAVLRAAGGRVVDFNTNRDLGYGKPGLENPYFIAVGAGVELLPPVAAR